MVGVGITLLTILVKRILCVLDRVRRKVMSGEPQRAERNYEGKYVAFGSPNDKRVVASGSDSGVVIDKAREQGVDVPTIVFVPKSDTAYIY